MPISVIKVRFESNMYPYRSLAEASADIFKKEGGRGFFSGFGATALRDAPYAGIQVALYESMKALLGGIYFLLCIGLIGSFTTEFTIFGAHVVHDVWCDCRATGYWSHSTL